CQQVYSTPFTF
nr:immunoglobulin light chain junction region [Macaca mulatta]